MAEAGPVLNRVVAPRRNVLTTVEFDVLWECLGLGPIPVVLQLPSPGRTATYRRDMRAQGWQALRDRGLAGPSGADPELARQLRLLVQPSEQLELRGTWGHHVRALAVGRTGAGVLAVRQDATVTLESCGSLPAALLGVLPSTDPRPGRATTVPTMVISAGLAVPRTGSRAALIARDRSVTEGTLLSRMLGAGRGRAQIAALVTDTSGVARRSGGVLGVLDGTSGRYLATRRLAEDGVEWTTVAPTDDRRLRHRVTELLDEARASVGAC